MSNHSPYLYADEADHILLDSVQPLWCYSCGEWTNDCVEPDARNYECPWCGGRATESAAECMLRGTLNIVEEEEPE